MKFPKSATDVSNAQNKIQLFPILLINFIGTLGFSIVLPFLVFLVKDFGGNAIVFGILSATYPTFQLIGAPILGRWSDTYGRKKILILSNAGTLVGWIFFLVALFLPKENILSVNSALFGTFVITLPLLVLFLARFIDGLTGGNISVANAYLADISSNENRSNNFGKMAISSNLGFIVGPALAAILGSTIFGNILPVLAALILSLVTLIVIPVTLKEFRSPPGLVLVPEKGTIRKVFAQECKECYEVEDPKRKLRFKDVFKLKQISFLLMLYFFIFLGFNIFYATFPIQAINGLKWSITQLGIFYAVLSGMMVLVEGPVLRKALKKSSEEKLVVIGNLILDANFILLVSNQAILVYCAAVFFALGNGLMWPSVLSLLSKRAGVIHQGSVQGIAGSFGSLASIIGLTVGGLLYHFLGAATFLISAAVIFAVFIMSFRLMAHN
ncbi:MAG TPA: MFS transporter [Nitrososphaeraceae archaeon]|nr:MFS transporter [Nitrososphaeraceae archaeon]